MTFFVLPFNVIVWSLPGNGIAMPANTPLPVFVLS
jgi:hypothetical protein